MMIATMVGGIFAGTNVAPVKAEEYPEMIVFEYVPYGFWAYDAILDLAYNKIIVGYGNGKYGVGDLTTREQVAALIYRVFDIEEQGEYENPYGDIDENSTNFIEEILALTELAQVLTNAFDLQAKGSHTLNDVSANSWAKNAISAIQTNGITAGIGDNKFGLSMKVKREQYAQFLYKAILHDMEQGQQ
ncbi:S-layer homology domain-containing protein [Bacillus wiedmannii]|uniref:S-layer homology domain-containing protein n=1 Tax=Bacillus wiedmannii TaxID=1890302 RepID=UPI000BF02BDF|nr:S-layer homology domain-containing protein [Bacillus wiedmannii]PEK62586.1 S-layer protein [Bacillus wiedmannii]